MSNEQRANEQKPEEMMKFSLQDWIKKARKGFSGRNQEQSAAIELSFDDQLIQRIIEQFTLSNTTAEFSLQIKDGIIDARTKEWNQDYTGFSYDTPAFRIFKLLFINEFIFEQKLDLTYVDIDLRNLKAINDLFGHEGGDKAIATYYLGVVAKAQAVLKSKGKTFYFIPNRLQAGGDELQLIIGGDIDVEELNQVISDLMYTEYSPKFGGEKTLTLGAEYAVVKINHEEDLLEQIKQLENEIKLPEEKKKNILELEKLDKAQYLLMLIQGKAETAVVNRKSEQLITELQQIEEDTIKIFLDGATNEDELKIDIFERKKQIDQIFNDLGSRRLSIGMVHILGLKEIFTLVIDRLERNEPLSTDLKFKIGLVKQKVQDQDHLNRANAAAGEQLRPIQAAFRFTDN